MNPVEQRVARAIHWIRDHHERFWASVGVAVLAVVLVVMVIRHRRAETEEAWLQLGAVQNQILRAEDSLGAAQKALGQWQERFGGTHAASFASFLKADLLYRTSDYTGAAQAYADLAQHGRPGAVKPLALSAQVAAEEMAGRLPQAQASAQTFLERYPDHYLAASMYMTQARLAELAGNPAAAVAVYERVVILYPQGPWTALARSRAQALGGSSNASSRMTPGTK